MTEQYPTKEVAKPSKADSRICGLRRNVFLVLIIAVSTLALALGFGLGLGLRSRSTDSAAPVTTTSPAAIASGISSAQLKLATAIATVSTTSIISSTSTPSARPTSGTASTSCPATNGTTYSTSGHTYLILCENDIQAPNKVDLGRVYQPSFNECIDSCAALAGDKRADISAVYWVDYNAAETGTCWCFGGTGRSDGAYVSHWSANNLAWIQS